MVHDHHMHGELTKNQKLVLDVVAASDQPQSAYDILDKLRGQGLKAPLQIYRALDKLLAQGLVHRLETLNAFVTCQHEHAHKGVATVFMICESCGAVKEASNACLNGDLQSLALSTDFKVAKTSIELRGRCANC